jgi:hypothetical protein
MNECNPTHTPMEIFVYTDSPMVNESLYQNWQLV